MEESFEQLVNSFLENKVGIAENFLSDALAAQLREKLLTLHSGDQLRAAGIGNQTKLIRDDAIRSDKIHWLDRADDDPHENTFFDLMDSFVSYLNRTCYTGIRGNEFHYALYEKGSFYKRHLDQFSNDDSRAYSVIMYLNPDWKKGDGGELCVYHEEEAQVISPANGKCVFFKSSELEHEVLLSHQPRMSVTGWFRRD